MNTIQLTESNQIWTLTLNRPEALNALNANMLGELSEAIAQINQMDFSKARALVVTGAGEKAFVAGADIKEMSSLDSSAAQEFAKRGQEILRGLEQLKIPVIAAVNGFALGGGLELALACDFIYASENAKFALPEVSLGLIPGFGGTVRLSRVVGLAMAKEMIFSGDMITAERALQIGLVNRVLPKAELMTQALKTAELMAQRGPIAVAHAKQSVMRSFDLPIDEAMTYEASMFGMLFGSQDTKEGTLAFIEKRKAKFVGA